MTKTCSVSHSFSSFSASLLSRSSSQLLTCIPRPTFVLELKVKLSVAAVVSYQRWDYSYNSLDSCPGSEKLVLSWGFFLVGRTWHFSVHCLTSPISLPSSPVRQWEISPIIFFSLTTTTRVPMSWSVYNDSLLINEGSFRFNKYVVGGLWFYLTLSEIQ